MGNVTQAKPIAPFMECKLQDGASVAGATQLVAVLWIFRESDGVAKWDGRGLVWGWPQGPGLPLAYARIRECS